jgi:hypothetical protein
MRSYILSILILFFACTKNTRAQNPVHLNIDSLKQLAALIKKANREQAAKNNYTHYVISNEAGGFGYCILVNGQVYLWQTTIPGRGGAKGFAKKEQSAQCAGLVIQKIKEGEMPPSLTEEELKRNNLLN